MAGSYKLQLGRMLNQRSLGRIEAFLAGCPDENARITFTMEGTFLEQQTTPENQIGSSAENRITDSPPFKARVYNRKSGYPLLVNHPPVPTIQNLPTVLSSVQKTLSKETSQKRTLTIEIASSPVPAVNQTKPATLDSPRFFTSHIDTTLKAASILIDQNRMIFHPSTPRDQIVIAQTNNRIRAELNNSYEERLRKIKQKRADTAYSQVNTNPKQQEERINSTIARLQKECARMRQVQDLRHSVASEVPPISMERATQISHPSHHSSRVRNTQEANSTSRRKFNSELVETALAEEQASKLSQRNSFLSKQLNESRLRIMEMSKKLQEKDMQIEDLSEKLAESEVQSDAYKKRVESKEVFYKEEIGKYMSKLLESEKEKEVYIAQLSRVKAEKYEAEKKSENILKNCADEKEKQLELMRKRIDVLAEEGRAREYDFSKCLRNIETLEQNNKQLKIENSKLCGQRTQFQRKLESQGKIKKGLQSQVKGLLTTHNQTEKFSKLNIEQHRIVQDLNKKLHQKQEQLKKREQQLLDIEKKLKEVAQKLDRTTKELEAENKAHQILKKNHQILVTTHENNRQQLDCLLQTNRSLQQLVSIKEFEREQAILMAEEEKLKRAEALQKLEIQIQRSVSPARSREKHRRQSHDLRQSKQQQLLSKQEIRSKEEAIDSLAKELINLRNSIGVIRQEKEALQQKNRDQQVTIKLLDQQIENTCRSFSEFKQAVVSVFSQFLGDFNLGILQTSADKLGVDHIRQLLSTIVAHIHKKQTTQSKEIGIQHNTLPQQNPYVCPQSFDELSEQYQELSETIYTYSSALLRASPENQKETESVLLMRADLELLSKILSAANYMLQANRNTQKSADSDLSKFTNTHTAQHLRPHSAYLIQLQNHFEGIRFTTAKQESEKNLRQVKQRIQSFVSSVHQYLN